MSRFVPALATTTVAVTMFAAAPAHAHQPGAVNCYAPDTRAEHAICASKRLTRIDDRMSDLFSQARQATSTRGELRDLHATQRHWVDARDRCGASRVCIWWQTKRRIRQLRRFIRVVS